MPVLKAGDACVTVTITIIIESSTTLLRMHRVSALCAIAAGVATASVMGETPQMGWNR
jgi:hypothetical protein